MLSWWLSTWLAAWLASSAEFEGDDYRAAANKCPSVEHCFALVVHVVVESGEPVRAPAWLAAQIAHANRLFAAIDVGFVVGEAMAESAAHANMQTRAQRDAIGRDAFTKGVVHVFVVEHLEDVDAPGNAIRGVHWRDRVDTSRRWIILSKIAEKTVLAHELGHFFGLPHSGYAVSVMNKRPRAEPSWEARVFADPEIQRMRKELTRMLAANELVLHRPRRSAPAGE